MVCSAAVAAVSGFFGARFVFALPWPFAVLAAVGWGVVVLTVTRLVLVSIRRGGRIPSRILAMFLRLVMVLLIGFITAVPLTLAVFRPDIEARLTLLHAQDAQTTQESIGQVDSTITELVAERFHLLGVLTGRANPAVANDPLVRAAAAAYNTALVRYTTAENDAASREARVQLERAEAVLNQVSADVAARLGVTVQPAEATRAQRQLGMVQDDLVDTEAHRRTLLAEAGDDQRGGLLAQLSALNDITGSNSAARWSELTLVAMFVLLQALPVLLGYLATAGPPMLYDRLVEAADQETALRAQRAAERERVIDDHYAAAQLELERDRIARSMEVSVAANQAMVSWLGVVAPREPDRDRPLWQAVTDGVGGVFGVFGGTRVPHPELPPFEATLAADVERLWRAFPGSETSSTTREGTR